MKRTQVATRKGHGRDRRTSAPSSNLVRRRSAGLKLEFLEERQLLSTTTKVFPPPSIVPSGLGLAYTALSEQAHGVGLATSSPTQYNPTGTTTTADGASPLTMAELEAYLKQLTATLSMGSGAASSSSQFQGPIATDDGGDGGDPDAGKNNAGNDAFGQDAYLWLLQHNPALTGLSSPAVLPTTITGFDGMNYLDSVNGYVPPDTNIAVGPNTVVEVVNAQIQFYDKATGAALLPNTPLNTFFGQPNESPFDPMVTYDDISGRFIVSSATFSSDLLLAVSKDSNPLDGFTSYDINASEGGFGLDYPKLGFNNDEVVITANMYPGPGDFHVQVLSFKASSLFSSSPPATLTLGTDYFSTDRTKNDFTLVPATMHGSKAGDPMYFVEENTYGDGANLRVVSSSNLLSSSPSFTDSAVGVAAYTEPPAALQPGGTIDTNDSRILKVDYRDGLLVAGQNVGLSTDSDAHARWYELSVSGSPSLVQQGTIAPAPGVSTYYPAIAIGAGDVIGMTYNQSSLSQYPSVYDTGRTPSDLAGTMETPALAHAGTATYSDFAGGRWGDYSGIAVDPSASGLFWSGAEYSTSTLSGFPANWATWISQFAITPTVISSSPAAGSIVTGAAPTTFKLTFSEPIDPTSIKASSFTVNGTAATSASLSANGLTITYSFTKSPVTQEGAESMALPAGSVKGSGAEQGNAAFSASFYYTATQLQVSATSPAVGSILTVPVTDLVVQFNKAFDPYSISAADFQLSLGSVVSAKPLSSQAVDLTLSGIAQEGTLTLTIPAGAILDSHEVPGLGFTGTYVLDIVTAPYPTPLTGLPPAGSLIYDPTATGTIGFVGDTDTYTLALAANQTLTVVMSTGSGLTGNITVTGPGNNVLGTATGSGAGQTVVLQTVPVTTAGTYSITVAGAGGTTGSYTVQAILNAVYKQSTDSINTIGTAENLAGAFASLGTTPAADRAGVVGNLGGASGPVIGPNGFDYGAVTVAPTFIDITGTGTETLQGTDDSVFFLDPSTLGGFTFNFYGQTYNSLYFSTNGLITFNNPRSDFSHYDLSSYPPDPTIAPYWTDLEAFSTGGGVWYQVQGTKLIIEWDNVRYYCCSGTPINFEAVLDSSDNTIQFNYGNLASGQFQDNGAYETVGIKNDNGASGGADRLLVDYNSGPSAFVNSNTSMKIGLGLADAPPDYYAVPLTAGQSTTIAIKGNGGQDGIGLYDGSGHLLALSDQGAGIDGVISNFVAPSSGTYYVKVTGVPGLQYDLVVTRGADFASAHNNTFNSAQPLDGTSVVLGSTVKSSALYTLDDNLYSPPFPIWPTDPNSGLFFVPSIPAPATEPNNPFGLNMAYDGTDLYYSDGAQFGTGTLYKLDGTGHVIAQTTPPNGFTFSGLAYLNGKLYAAAAFDTNIYVFDANTLASLGTINDGISDSVVTGLAGDPDRGVLWAVGQTGGVGNLYEINPTTGAVIKQGNDNNQGLNEQDLAYAGGMLIVSDTNGLASSGGTNVLDEYNPDTFAFIQRVPVAVQGFVSGLAGDGLGGIGSDYYQFNVNAGDNLVLTTTTPGGTSANGLQFVNGLMPTLNLYDASGNLVATATANAGDHRNDVINWTALSSGSYRVQIVGANKDNVGEYTIAIQGATGGHYPFSVTSTNPAAGSDLDFQPSTMTVVVDNSIRFDSVSPSDLTIDGMSATGVTVIDNHTLSFALPGLIDGVHSVSITGIIDIHGTALTADNFSFTTDTVAPTLVSSSIPQLANFSPAPQDITDVMIFSEPMNTSLVPSVDLYGEFRGVHYAVSSYSWDPTGTSLTITYDNVPSDSYQFYIFTYGFQDVAGNTLSAGLLTNFTVTAGTSALTGLQPVNPLGSLVYQGGSDQVLVSTFDTDTYDLTIDPHQTIAVLVTPSPRFSNMIVTVTLTAPDGTVTTVTSPSNGAPALIPAVQSADGGTYVIQVTGDPGEYTIQATLNALIDPVAYGGPPDNTIGTAQPLDAYANPFASGADRTAVLGSILGASASFGDALVVETGLSGDVVLVDQSSGAILQHFKSPAFSGLYLFDIALAPDNTFYVLGDQNAFTGVIVHMDLQGDTLGTITVPVTDSPGFLSPEGFGLDPRDGSFWIPLANSAELVHIDSSGNFLNEYFIGGSVDDAAVGPDGAIYISQVFGNDIERFDPSTGIGSFFASSPFPLGVTWSVAGDLWVGALDGGAQEFDSSGNLINQVDFSGPSAAEPTLSGNIWDTNLFSSTINQFTSTGGLLTQTSAPLFQPGLAVLGDVPNEAPLPPPVNPIYSIHLDAGQSASFVIQGLNGKNVSLTLMDGSGNVLALSSTGASNYSAGINDFVARTSDTYYVQVSGTPGIKFNLVVTRGADFDTEKNNTIATAQAFDGNGAILGAITKGSTPFFVLDDNLYSPPFPIWHTDPNTGLFFVPSTPAPATEPNNPFGLNMAFDGTDLWYNDGPLFGSNTVYKVDPDTGTVLTSWVPQEPNYLFAIAYFDGHVWGTDNTNIYEFDNDTGAVIKEFDGVLDGNVTGLAGDPDRGVLWAVSQFHTIFEIDPNTGAILKSGPDNAQGLNEQDLAYVGGMLIVSDTNGLGSSGGTNVLDEYNPDTLAFIQRVPVAVSGFVSGLGGDGLGTATDDVDYYSFQASAGDTLTISTTTPGGGPGEFANGFYPKLSLYDSNGNLIASAEGDASDGRNSVIMFTVPGSGTYYIEVSQADNTPTPTVGEYGLVVSGATGGLPAMTVTSTTPADGSLVQPPTTYTATFDHAVYVPSLTAGEFTINGVPATSVTLVDPHTVTWTIPAGAITDGNRVLNTVVISADPGSGQRIEDISGTALADFTSTFTTDDVAPFVLSSSINNGDVFSPAPASVTEVVTFSEPMNTVFTTAASFDLHGNYRNSDLAAASFSWDSTGTILTINYANVPDDTYTLTLFAGGFQDLVGLPMASNYTVGFAVAVGTTALPTPFQPTAPLGSQIYTSSDTHVLVTPMDVDSLTVNINPGQTLTVIITPTTSTLQPSVTVLGPGNVVLGSATAPGAGQAAVIETVPISTGGIYTIQVSDSGGNTGLYSIQADLNTFVKTSTSNDTLGGAQDLNGSSIALGSGTADRLAAVGSLLGGPNAGDVYVSARYEYYYDGTPEILHIDGSGNIVQKIPVNDPFLSLSGVELDPVNNLLYAAVTTSFNASSVSGVLLAFDPITGKQVGAITLPDDPAENFYYYPYGFSIGSDGSFWVPQPNSENIVHLDASGNLLASYSVAGVLPESATVRADGQVYFSGYGSSTGIYLLNPSNGSFSLFAAQPSPDMTQIAATGGVWSGDYINGAQRFDDSGNLLQTVGYYGSIQAQTDPSGNIWTSNFNDWDEFRFDPSGNQQIATFAPGALGQTVWGVDNPNAPAPDDQDYYSFSLTAGQSVTIVVESLNGMAAQVALLDQNGNPLASGVAGSTNVSQSIQNFVAPTAGKYYVKVTGDIGVRYSLVVTRSANFDIEPHGTPASAQPLTGTNGVAGAIDPGGTLSVGQNIEGIDFNGSPCGCLPPDTNAAVGGNYIFETVNFQVRVFDKTNGATLLDEPLSAVFGQSTVGDPYVVYDSIANRWYVTAFNGSASGLLLAVSKDANPLDGFLPAYSLTASSGPDYPKMGYNKDAIFVSFNDFATTGQAKIDTINKADALAGTLTDFVSAPAFQFRAMPAAQLSHDTTGGTEWFVSTDGSDVSGNSMRVTEMTNYFSNNPTFTYTSLPVAAYQGSSIANQPGGTWTTFPNTTTTQVLEAANGELVTAMSSATAADGFTYDKGQYFVVDISGGTPTLVKQGVVDPGAGVSVEMFTAAMDSRGNLGFTWMQGSSTEFVSMYVGSLDTQGHFSSYDATPNAGFFNVSFRIGDYSSIVIDPTDGNTFWAANEYSGQDSASDIWRTHITSFSLPPAVNNDWYTINIGAGNTLTLQSYIPSTQGGQYPNADPVLNIQLYDTFGNLVATGTTNPDGHNQTLTYKATIGGQYHILVYNNAGTSGEYFLQVSTPSYAAGSVTGEVFNDLNGNGKLDSGDPGLDNWEVDVYSSTGTKVASQMTQGGGNYDFEGLAPGTYTVKEVLQSGWTLTTPAAGSFTATVTAGHAVSGLNFGDFQNVTLSGAVYNDLNGDGAQEPGEPGLAKWTVQLLNSAGKVVASATTGASGNYSFTNLGPGTYKVQEVLQGGWILSSSPSTFTVAATSGQNAGGLSFGDFQLLSYSGSVYNDVNGNGVMDKGDGALNKWTVNLLNSLGTVVASDTTNGNGNYSFNNLGPGKWTIQEINQSGWYQTQPVNPPGVYSFAAVSGSNQSNLNYGNFQIVSLSGLVYNDVNGDGKKQGNEPGLANWTVELLNPSGNVVSSLLTDSKGNYTFGQVFPGTFTVEEIPASGWVQTQPKTPPVYTITTQSGQNVSGLVFGVHQSPPKHSAVATAGGQAGPAGAAQTSTAPAIAALDTSTSTASNGSQPSSATGQPVVAVSKSAAPAATAVSITGISPPTPLKVVYKQGTQPVANQPTAPLVDVVLGLVSTRTRVVQPVVTDQAATSLARSLLGKDDHA